MAQFPTALPDLVDILTTEHLSEFHAGFGHVEGENYMLATDRALASKIGITDSPAHDSPLANTLFGSLANGKSGWRQVQASDITPGTATLLKIAQVTVTGSPAATIDFTNIPQTYKGLELWLSSKNNTGGTLVNARFSSDGTTFDTGSNYDTEYSSIFGAGAVSGSESLGATSCNVAAHAQLMSGATICFPDYTNTTDQKAGHADASYKASTTTGNIGRYMLGFWWRNTAAIKGIRLFPGANSFGVGTVATLYGLPA